MKTQFLTEYHTPHFLDQCRHYLEVSKDLQNKAFCYFEAANWFDQWPKVNKENHSAQKKVTAELANAFFEAWLFIIKSR